MMPGMGPGMGPGMHGPGRPTWGGVPGMGMGPGGMGGMGMAPGMGPGMAPGMGMNQGDGKISMGTPKRCLHRVLF